MSVFRFLKRPFIWLFRFRHRCGYGVHSPFAFDLITKVIYENTPYYAYKELKEKEKKMNVTYSLSKGESLKIKRLLFRLVNCAQPKTIVDVGIHSASSLYLCAACRRAEYVAASDLSELFLEADIPVDFLYLHDYCHPGLVEQTFQLCVLRTVSKSLFVVEGIHYSKAMKALWHRMQEDERTGISFDLYDLGLIFFDKTKIKQHYIVNF